MSVTWFAERLLAAHAFEDGDGLALVEGEVRLTWRELDARVTAVAAHVTACGAAPGERVGIALSRASDAAVAILGTLRALAVAAPLPARLTEREVALALDVTAPALVLRDAIPAPTVGPPSATLPPLPAPVPEAPAVVVLTSGTTGRPKGVVLSSRALAASADAWLAVLPPATGWALPLGVAHVAGLGIVWRALRRRVPVWLLPPGDPTALLAVLRGTGPSSAPSHVSLVPVQLLRLLDVAGDAPPPATVRAVLLGGGQVPPALVERAARAGWPVMPTYGLSEMGSGVTALAADEVLEAPSTAGRPLPGMRLRIDAPDAEGVGEIVVAGPARCSGYLGEPPEPPDSEVRTGDLGRLDGLGRLVVVERRTDRIVRGGENVDPSEVEAVLATHPAVAEAAVVARPDAARGQVPVAAVVLRAGVADAGDDTLLGHARASLAGFKVPAAILRLDALPRTASGKLRREAIRAFLAGEAAGELARPGGDAIGWRITGAGARTILLLPGTLSTAGQLDRLAAELAARGDVTVHALDRRGTGTGRLSHPRPLDIAVHVDDLVTYLDARGIARAALVGVSFGGVLALEAAARRPARFEAVVAYEPPYGPVADARTVAWFQRLAAATAEAHRSGGPAAAAETFLRAVAGDVAWDRLPPRGRAFLQREGDGVLADAGLRGLDPAGLGRIAVPVAILAGDMSEPFYAAIADALAARIPGARRATVPGLSHTSPISDPAPVAAAVCAFLEPPA